MSRRRLVFFIITLLSDAWPQDAASSPLSGLLNVEQRQAAAGRLNAAVLQSQQQEKGPWLTDLLRQVVYSQVGALLVLMAVLMVVLVLVVVAAVTTRWCCWFCCC